VRGTVVVVVAVDATFEGDDTNEGDASAAGASPAAGVGAR